MPNILIIDIDNPYSVQTILYSHEANVKHFVNVAFQREGNIIDVTNGYTVTADLVCDNILIVQDVAVNETTIQGTPCAQLNIAPADGSFTVPAGRLQIDFALTNTSDNSVIHPVAPLIVRVMPAPAEHAQINENSLGSYAEVVREIADARGEETTLGDRIDRIDGDVATISNGQLPDGRYMLFAEYGAVGTDLIANGAVNTSKLTNGAVTSEKLAANSVTTEKIVDSAVTAGKIDGGAVGEAQLATDAVTTAKIKDKAVTPEKLNLVLRNLLTQLTDMLEWYNQTDIITLSDLGTIQNTTPLNLALSNKTIYNFVAAAGAAQTFGVESGTSCQMVFIGDYQVVTFAVYNKRCYRHIDSYAPSFVAGDWVIIDDVGDINAALESIMNGGV